MLWLYRMHHGAAKIISEGGLFISPLKWEGYYPMEPNSLTITQAHIKKRS